MPVHIKKTISIILLFIFLYNISGYYIAFSVQQTEVKKIVRSFFRSGGQEDMLVLRILAEKEKEIVWYNQEEFNLNGKMYDVAFMKHEKNILLLYCYNDSKEDHLFTSLNSHFKNNIPVPQKNSGDNLKVPFPDYFAGLSQNGFFTFDYDVRIEIQLNFSLENFYLDKPSPPPRLT